MTYSNFEFVSLELQRFLGISKNDRDKLRARFGWRWCRRPRVPWPGPVDQVARLSETGVAFARSYVCGVETAIAFAGQKRAFFDAVVGRRGDGGFNGCCSGASSGDGGFTLARISGYRGVIGFKVGTWLCVSAKKFALLGPVRTPARKSSPSVLRKAKNWRFMACWANFVAQQG